MSSEGRWPAPKYQMRLFEITSTRPPLPAPGQKPWWVDALAPMTKELWREHTSWTAGGCFAFADRLQKAYGGQQWCVARFDEAEGDWAADHAVVRIGGVYYDFNGVFDPQKYVVMLVRQEKKTGEGPYRREMKRKGSPGLFWFEDENLDDIQWKQLLMVLKTGQPL